MTSIPFSSINQTLTLKKHQCPCGANQCYIEEEEPITPEQEDNSSTHPNFTLTPKDPKITIPPPYIGQTFQTDEEALEYYNNFARCNGFSTRRERSKGNPDHPLGVYKRELVCHRAGNPLPPPKQPDSKTKKRKKSVPVRCKCEAQMVVKKSFDGLSAKWVVTNFNNVHNHEFVEGNFVNPPIHKYISQPDKDRILNLAKSGCNLGFIIKSLEMEKGVKPGQLALTEKDVKNFLLASESAQPEHEGVELLKSCKVMRERDPEFRYEFSSRENNKLENILWSYLGAIRGYEVFGDVVIFDRGYKLYTYERPVLAWFGVDNNGNLVFFAGAVLFDESLESYNWAFQAFLKINGKHPQTILTDLSPDLKAIIQSNLPNTKHAFSFFHITSKLPTWFALSLGPEIFEKFKFKFYKLNELETIEEFEQEWGDLVREFELVRDRHADFLFSNRFFWVSTYLKSWFFGGLLGSNHPILIRDLFKGFLKSNTRLKDFVEQVGVAVDFQNQASEETTTNQNNFKPNLKTCLPLEEHASSILTPYSFSIFQREISLSTQYAVFDASNDTYLVPHYLKTGTSGAHLVSCIPSTNEFEINCTCKGFEFDGVLCRHIIRVLCLKNCFTVPERYLLPRWRRDGSLFSRNRGIKYRFKALKSLGNVIMHEGVINKDRFEYVQFHLGGILNHVRNMDAGENDVVASDWLDVNATFDAEMDVRSAGQVATRGRPRKCKKVGNEDNALL